MSVEAGRARGVEGGAGAVPPPDAPQETALPITPDAESVMRARAASNEKTLPPFAPKATGPVGAKTPVAPVATAVPAASRIRKVARPVVAADGAGIVLTDAELPTSRVADVDQIDQPLAGDPADVMAVADADAGADIDTDTLPPLTADDRARMPAASDTDTPSRGAPKIHPGQQPIDKQITGGFSDALDAQYFPLDGTELGQLVLALMDQLAAQIPNDLRFSMALTYPRVRARVRVEIEGHAEDADAGFVIEKIALPAAGQPGSTPLEIARQRADQIVFVVQQVRQEVSEGGENDLPPDALRDQLGLTRPQKQLLTDSNGRQTIVDRLPTDLAALTGGGR